MTTTDIHAEAEAARAAENAARFPEWNLDDLRTHIANLKDEASIPFAAPADRLWLADRVHRARLEIHRQVCEAFEVPFLSTLRVACLDTVKMKGSYATKTSPYVELLSSLVDLGLLAVVDGAFTLTAMGVDFLDARADEAVELAPAVHRARAASFVASGVLTALSSNRPVVREDVQMEAAE